MTTIEIARKDKHGNALPPVILTQGMEITRTYQGKTIRVKVLDRGQYLVLDGAGFLTDGTVWSSFNAMCNEVTGRKNGTNALDWWGLVDDSRGKGGVKSAPKAPVVAEDPETKAMREQAQALLAEVNARNEAKRRAAQAEAFAKRLGQALTNVRRALADAASVRDQVMALVGEEALDQRASDDPIEAETLALVDQVIPRPEATGGDDDNHAGDTYPLPRS